MSKTRRKLPPTPASTSPDSPVADPQTEAVPGVRLAHRSAQVPEDPEDDVLEGEESGPQEPQYLIQGTGCKRGHEPGEELIEPRLGKVPSRRLTRIGLGLILWAMLGMAFLPNLNWLLLAILVSMLWLAFSGIVQRRAGHRRRCWRTRAWRYAWGGLVPLPRQDPTREA